MSFAIIPLVSCVVSFIFALTVLDQFFARRKPYQLVWTIGLFMYFISTGTEFWTTGVGINIYRLSTTGTLIRSINAPERGYDIAFGDGFLWHVASNIYKLTTNGSFVSSFSFSGRNLRGICWAAPYLWLADVGKNQVFQMTTQGSIVDYFPIPHQPYGVTCEGAYVWYSVTSNQHVYKMYPYSTNAIVPVSLGKVKALYR